MSTHNSHESLPRQEKKKKLNQNQVVNSLTNSSCAVFWGHDIGVERETHCWMLGQNSRSALAEDVSFDQMHVGQPS